MAMAMAFAVVRAVPLLLLLLAALLLQLPSLLLYGIALAVGLRSCSRVVIALV